jgi:hypothetical protein
MTAPSAVTVRIDEIERADCHEPDPRGEGCSAVNLCPSCYGEPAEELAKLRATILAPGVAPTAVVIDTYDGAAYWQERYGELFTTETARAFAAKRNGGAHDSRPLYRVFTLTEAPEFGTLVPALCLPMWSPGPAAKKLRVILTADGTVLAAADEGEDTLPVWVRKLTQLPPVTVTASEWRRWKRATQPIP